MLKFKLCPPLNLEFSKFKSKRGVYGDSRLLGRSPKVQIVATCIVITCGRSGEIGAPIRKCKLKKSI